MDIYLVRVSQRSDKSLFIERHPNATTNDDYIAILHVWGSPDTIQLTHIDGVGDVQLSPGKKDILSILKRPDICGDGWFWMDLFCIDQTESASITISDQLMAIPAIYKHSRCVKVLIESPVCQVWQETATRVIGHAGAVDEDIFGEEEMRHGRKCPHFLFCDPWFERLWTRQEGLYGMVLDVIALCPVACSRLTQDTKRGWIAVEGTASAKRTTAAFFLDDKLAYHGASDPEKIRFQLYLDFMYRRRVDIAKYAGMAGPIPDYSPISEAWRSGRITTKPRDYVLAVFPDIEGYRAPPKARKMQFHELLADALGQTAIQERMHTAAKIPKGMVVETSSRDSATPWIPSQPSNISEAYDSFIGEVSSDPKSSTDGKFFPVARKLTFEPLDLSRDNLDEIKSIWAATTDMVKQFVRASPCGPCFGTVGANVQTDQGLLHLYFVHQFAPLAVETFLPKEKFDELGFATKGMLSFDKVKDISEDVFGLELRRFLVCLVCGTTLHTADEILKSADLGVVSTTHGRLLGMVRREVLTAKALENPMLITTSVWNLQGFFIGQLRDEGSFMVGRTVIPTLQFWDKVVHASIVKE